MSATNTYTGLFQVLAAAINEASMAKKHRNWLCSTITQDYSPEFAAPFSTINTNIANSGFAPTNLGSGTTLNPSAVNLDPGPVTLTEHPSLAFDLPSVDIAKAGQYWVRKTVDEALKSIANYMNGYVATLMTTAHFNAYGGDGGIGFIDGGLDSEKNVFNDVTITNNDIVLTPTLARAWKTLADSQVPMRDQDLFLAMPSGVFANQLQHPNWTAALGVGSEIAGDITRTAIINRRWNVMCDYDPDLDTDTQGSAGGFVCPLYHRYSTAIVSRAIPPPAAPFEYAYSDFNGMSIRMTVGFYQPTMSNRLTFDALFGAAVVRPDYGILIRTK